MEAKENRKRQNEMEMEEELKNQNSARKAKSGKKFGWAWIFGVLGIILIVFVVIGSKYFKGFSPIDDMVSDTIVGEEGKVTTISSMSLEKVFEINELSTSQYTYNAIARAYDEDGTDVRYYVAYEGKVTVGIDFGKLKYDIDEEEKTITVMVPEIEIHDKTVDPGTLKFIFKESKSETETIHQEAFSLCEKDLEERVVQEEALLEQAKQNTIAVVQALVEPWVRQIDTDYKVIIQ